MLTKATQTHRQLALFTALGNDALLLERFDGREALSTLFEFELFVLSETASIDHEELLGTNVTWVMTRDQGAPRYFNGYISEFGQVDQTNRGNAYEARVVPWTWFLTQSTNCRIFQNMTAPEIIRKVVSDFGFHGDFDDTGLTGEYESREYCVQYRETAFAFISRLMEEEGIFYFFHHENGRHSMVLADSTNAYETIDEADVAVARWEQLAGSTTHVIDWERNHQLRPGRWTTCDFNFKRPKLDLSSSVPSKVELLAEFGLEAYEYPGRYQRKKAASQLTKVRMEEEEANHASIKAVGSRWTFSPAARFVVTSHPDSAERNREYAITAIEYQAGRVGSFTSGDGAIDDQSVWTTTFEGIASDVVFRPSRRTPKAIIPGPQTATVVGPRGEQIHADKHGRIKCHFHWDRESRRNEHSSCWMRVSQVHAGAGWGSIDLPRIGEEVVVAFLDGDPDRPIVKGRVYNGDTKPPFDLPGDMARSGLKSNTHKGSGYNELSMNDSAGAEQARVNAQFNMDSVVRNNQKLAVGVDRSADIVNNDSLIVGVNKSSDVGSDAAVTVGNNLNYVAGSDIVIDSGVSITLACGASTIHMNCGGVITVSGQFVSSLAAATHSIVAPMTEIAGAQLLNQAGLFCLDLGGICHVKGGETSVAGSSVNVSGGITVVKGAPIELGSVGAPIVTLPGAGGGGGGGVGGPASPGGLPEQDAIGLSQAAYGAGREFNKDDVIEYNGKEWKVLEAHDEDSGFQALVLEGENGETVLAVAGTDFFTAPDYDDNIGQQLGGVPPQYQRVDELAAELKADHPNLVVTGHSLGGGLANYASGVHGLPGVAFNAPPLNSGTLAQIAQRGPAGSTDNFVHYNNQYDVIHQLPGSHPGTVVTHHNTNLNPLTSHFSANVNPNDPIVANGPLADEVYQEYWRQRLNNPQMTRPDPPKKKQP